MTRVVSFSRLSKETRPCFCLTLCLTLCLTCLTLCLTLCLTSVSPYRDPGGIPPRIPAGTGILPRSRQDPANAAIVKKSPGSRREPGSCQDLAKIPPMRRYPAGIPTGKNSYVVTPGSRQESWRVDFLPGSRKDGKLSRRDPAGVKFSPRFPARISPGILFLPGSRQEKITGEKHCGNKSR